MTQSAPIHRKKSVRFNERVDVRFILIQDPAKRMKNLKNYLTKLQNEKN